MSQCPYANLMDPSFVDGGLDNAEIARIREAGPAAVSYTHLTLPTIYSV